jgi:hypothetical protein
MSATPEYYVGNPVDAVQLRGDLSDLMDAPLGEFLAGNGSSLTLKVFFRTFGASSVANEVNKVISRDGDYAIIDGERFLFEQLTKPAITALIATKLVALVVAPEAYIVASIADGLGVLATSLIWSNLIQPAAASAEAYFGTAQTRIEIFDATGTASVGVRYRDGLQGLTEIDAVKFLIGRGLDQAATKPAVNSYVKVLVNDAETTKYDILDPNILQQIADPLGITVAQIEGWNYGDSALN